MSELNLLAAPSELPLFEVATENPLGFVSVLTLQVKVPDPPASRNSVLFCAVVSRVTAAEEGGHVTCYHSNHG